MSSYSHSTLVTIDVDIGDAFEVCGPDDPRPGTFEGDSPSYAVEITFDDAIGLVLNVAATIANWDRFLVQLSECVDRAKRGDDA